MVTQHFCAQLLLPSAAATGGPIAVKVTNLAPTGKTGKFRQCFAKHGFVPLPVLGRAESTADGVVDKDRARGRDFAHDVKCRANDQRGNASPFDDMSDETDGLVTKRSIGDEEGEIDFGVL